MLRSLIKRKKNDEHEPTATYDEGSLFIDCRKCAGTSSLGDAECVRCVSSKICGTGPVSRLLMRKDNDIEHSDNVKELMNGLSEIASLLHTASSQKPPKRCATCPCSIPKISKEIWNSFPEPRFDIIGLEVERSDPKKEGCEECLGRTMSFIGRVGSMSVAVRKKAAKTAFRLAEV